MPTFVTKLIHDTSPDFGDNPQTITESGRPESITMQGLTPNTAHYCKGEIYQDGVLNDTSEVETFTTLQAGTLTLTYYNTTRSGYLYDYVFQYTSTYAPSWCTCVVNGSTFNGFFDSNQHVLNFNITGLSPSTTYPTVVTLADIYGETTTANGSITTTYVNQILIMDTDAEENYVDVGLTYVVDGGFYNGWVDVWYDYQDPSTDLSLQHYFFSEGDTVIHCDGLTANTGYLFRASITLDDRTTVINSNVVEESTTVAVVPLSFTDITGIDNTLTLTKNGSAPTVDLEYSTDGTTWTTWTETNNVRTLTIPANGTVYLRGNNANGFAAGYDNYHSFSSTGNVNAGGDITSIISKGCTTTIPQWAFAFMFLNMSTLKTPPTLPATTLGVSCYKQLFCSSGITSAPVLPATTLAESCYEEMFVFTQYLTTPPALPATTLAQYCYHSMFGYGYITTTPEIPAATIPSSSMSAMFEHCGSITSAPAMPNVTRIEDYGMSNVFYGCSNMTEGIDLRNVTYVGYRGLEGLYNECHSLNVAYAPTITWNTETTEYWMWGVAASGTLYADDSIASGIPLNSEHGCPTGWNVVELYNYLCFKDLSGASNTLTLTKTGNAPTVSLQYSTDKRAWDTWEETNNVRSIVIPANGKVYLRGDNANGFAVDNDNCHYFRSAGNVNAEGDLMRIINKNGSTTIPENGFRKLFNGMSTLKKAPAINATTYGSRCCWIMFQGTQDIDTSNIKIVNPVFPSGSVGQFTGMFMGCRFTRVAEIFDGGTITPNDSAYAQMFAFNTNLTTSPEFTINSSSDNSYGSMFQNCSALTDISKIHFNAQSIASRAMSSMFINCTSLTSGLDLRSATSIDSNAISNMYSGCTSLSTAYAPTVTWNTAKSNNWLNNVAATGTLYADKSIINSIPTDSASGCPTGWNVYENEYVDKYFTVKNESNTTNDITITSTAPTMISVYVSTDNGNTWTEKSPQYASSTVNNLGTLDVGGKMLIKYTGNFSPDNGHRVITGSTVYSVEGNIASLCFGDNFIGSLTASDYCLQGLFYNSTNIVSAENLKFDSFTTLATSCYRNMFYGCTNLITTPELPATTLANQCYYYMFSGCTSLTTAPVTLPATNLDRECYDGMFKNCTSLTTAPNLPATTLATNCYYGMFQNCTSLTTAPNLPATTAYSQVYGQMFDGCISLTTAPIISATSVGYRCCYYMFKNCTSLTTAPNLPATNLDRECYEYMFSGCTSLTTAPVTLPATTLFESCYASMFSGCTSLTTAPNLPATTLVTRCYEFMLAGCTSLTTAPNLPATTLGSSCYYGMFYNCTSLTTAPNLPATTLGSNCYEYMFSGCTSLTTAPNLQAKTLVSGCYNYIFQNCSKINSITVGATSWNTSYTRNWVSGVAATGTFTKPSATSIETGVNGIPSGWTVVNI